MPRPVGRLKRHVPLERAADAHRALGSRLLPLAAGAGKSIQSQRLTVVPGRRRPGLPQTAAAGQGEQAGET